jgi:hypothetical protein
MFFDLIDPQCKYFNAKRQCLTGINDFPDLITYIFKPRLVKFKNIKISEISALVAKNKWFVRHERWQEKINGS